MDGHIFSRRRKSDGKLRWYYAIRLPSGQRVRKVVGTREQAQAALAKLQGDIFAGRYVPEAQRRPAVTVADVRDRWLAHAEHKKSLADDQARLERAVAFFGPTTAVSSLAAADVDRFKAHLMAAAPKTRGAERLSATTVNHHLKVLRAAMRLAVTRGELDRDPTQGVRLVKVDNERDRVATGDELRRLILAAGPELRAAIILGVETGMRLGNVAGLRWERIDLAGALAVVPEVEVKTGVPLAVPLTEAAIEALKTLEPRAEGRVFSVAARTLSENFRTLTRRLEISDLHFHDLRHTAASEVAAGGADILTLMRLFGWRSMATAKRYVTPELDSLRDALKARKRGSKV
jgi:integrase